MANDIDPNERCIGCLLPKSVGLVHPTNECIANVRKRYEARISHLEGELQKLRTMFEGSSAATRGAARKEVSG